MKDVNAVNFIMLHGLNHRWFEEFLDKIGSEYVHSVYYYAVSWHSRGMVLQLLLSLLEGINVFLT
jgi:hypothetical protein